MREDGGHAEWERGHEPSPFEVRGGDQKPRPRWAKKHTWGKNHIPPTNAQATLGPQLQGGLGESGSQAKALTRAKRRPMRASSTGVGTANLTRSASQTSPPGGPVSFAGGLDVLLCCWSDWFTGVTPVGWAPGGVGWKLPPPRRVFAELWLDQFMIRGLSIGGLGSALLREEHLTGSWKRFDVGANSGRPSKGDWLRRVYVHGPSHAPRWLAGRGRQFSEGYPAQIKRLLHLHHLSVFGPDNRHLRANLRGVVYAGIPRIVGTLAWIPPPRTPPSKPAWRGGYEAEEGGSRGLSSLTCRQEFGPRARGRENSCPEG